MVGRMSGALVDGGPLEGALNLDALGNLGVVERIVLTHVRCACEWCNGFYRVEHHYRRNEDGVFEYVGALVV
jgi:hypothetical protein